MQSHSRVRGRLYFWGFHYIQGHDYDLVQEFSQLLPCEKAGSLKKKKRKKERKSEFTLAINIHTHGQKCV